MNRGINRGEFMGWLTLPTMKLFWGKIGRCRTVSKYKMGNFYDFGEAGSDFAIHHLPHMKLEKRLHYIAFEKELFVFRLDTEFM